MYKAILFDLDGTLTESGEGITKSVRYALEKLGKPAPPLEELRVFVEMPLMEQFMKYADLDEEGARLAVNITGNGIPQWGFLKTGHIRGWKKCWQSSERRGTTLRWHPQAGAFCAADPGAFSAEGLF